MARRREHGKLVRDRIPDIIARTGGRCEVAVMDAGEYRAALLAKLVEEAREAAGADDYNLVTELADLCEVVEAICDAHRISQQTLLTERARRREERGGFEKRLKIVWSE
jgi:predicted house-cleaning noncanonical NTP pyrophosphatase (MazG superfamily)